MKKGLFWVLAGMIALTLASCENNGMTTPDETVVRGNQVLTLSVSSEGSRLKAGRPLLSEAPGQNIDLVKVVVVDAANKLVFAKTYTDWQNESSLIGGGISGKESQIVLSADEKLNNGTYKAYAVGYTSDPAEYYDLGTKTAEWTADNALAGNTTLTLPVSAVAQDQSKAKAEEVFAGAVDFTITGGEFRATLNLHRQVSGTYGYFTNLPAEIDGKAATNLRLVASDLKKEVVFDKFNSEFTTTGQGARYVVNGKSSVADKDASFADSADKDAYTVYNITLTDWFTAGDSNGDGLLNGDDTWAKPAELGGVYDNGSVFAGEFLIPFRAVDGKSTLQLQLLDANAEVLKYWNVKLPTGDGQLAGGVTIDDVNEGAAAVEETAVTYSLVRNHLYALGKRAGGDNGGGDPDPEGPDEPTDLNKGQDLTVRVVDAWEVIHDMELD